MRSLILSVLFGSIVLCASLAHGSASTVYVSQNGGTFSGGSACNGQSTISLATLNSSSSWGSGSTQIGPGTTVYLCGTLTQTLGNDGITVQNSGSNGNPLTILCDLNCILQSPAFSGCADGPASGSYGAGGGINANGKSYLILDGGTNGIIQNTANGTNLANHVCSLGINDNGDYNIVRNWTVQNIYVNVANGSDTSGGSTAGIYLGGTDNHFAKICNNTFNDSSLGAELNTNGSVTAFYSSVPTCSSNTLTNPQFTFFNNTVHDHNWQIHMDGTGTLAVYNNDVTNWSNYFNNGAYHQDGFFVTGNSPSTFYVQIFDNYIYGDIGGASPTGFWFFTDDSSATGGATGAIYNNIMYGTGGSVTCCQGITQGGDEPTAPKGPFYIYNNTLVNTEYSFQPYQGSSTSPTTDIRNNVFYTQSSSYFYLNQDSPGYSFSTATFQSNDYFGGRTNPFGNWTTPTTFSSFKSQCASGGGTDCDSASTTNDPTLSGESSFSSGGTLTASQFVPLSGSAAIGLGANLTSLCSTYANLCQGAPQTMGAGGSCGTGCVSRASSGNWDAGAYPDSSSNPSPAPPTGLAALVQ